MTERTVYYQPCGDTILWHAEIPKPLGEMPDFVWDGFRKDLERQGYSFVAVRFENLDPQDRR